MNDLFIERMTLQEIADVTGVSRLTVTRVVQEIFPSIIKNGITTKLTKDESETVIKSLKFKGILEPIQNEEVVNNEVLPARTQVLANLDDIEMMQKSFEVLRWMQGKIKVQDDLILELTPKAEFHDAVTDSSKCFGMSETAQLLNLGFGRNKLYTLLKAEKILKESKEPYQQYIEQGYFKIILKSVAHGGQEIVTLVTGKGLAWLQKKYQHTKSLVGSK